MAASDYFDMQIYQVKKTTHKVGRKYFHPLRISFFRSQPFHMPSFSSEKVVHNSILSPIDGLFTVQFNQDWTSRNIPEYGL